MPKKPKVPPNATSVVLGTPIHNIEDIRAAKREWSRRLLKRPAIPSFRVLTAAVTPDPQWNLVGVGIGEKISDGFRTGTLAVKFLVRAKYPPQDIGKGHRLPKAIAGLPVDVEEVGLFRSFRPTGEAMAPAATQVNPRTKTRPAQPGCSIGYADPAGQFKMAGTLGALVSDTNGTYILSNNHVLTDESRLPAGSPIFQPGLLDGGNAGTDGIASLTRFIPFQAGILNQVDCAITQVANLGDVSNSILQIGAPKGVGAAQIDMTVEKFGRTTAYKAGQVTSIDTDVTVGYDTGNFAFGGQIIIVGLDAQPFSGPGDSGSLIVERNSKLAVGLLFAGSSTHTIANHISDVLSALNVALV